MKDTYIPIFNNRPEDYKEWRQRITLYRKKTPFAEQGEGSGGESSYLSPRASFLEMPNWALNALNAFRTRFCCWDAFSIGPPSHHTCGTHFDVPRTPSASLNKFSQSVDASPNNKGM